MADIKSYAFYLKDPTTTLENITSILQKRYPQFKMYYRSELFTLGGPDKYSKYIQVDQNLLKGIKICISKENMITILPNMGNGPLSFILGYFEFLFSDFKLAAEVGDYLRGVIGETSHRLCYKCNRKYPHYVTNCPKCNGDLIDEDPATGSSAILPPPTFGDAQVDTGGSQTVPSSGERIGYSKLIQPSVPPKDPIFAAILSALFAGGGGQIFLGQKKKGIGIIALTLVLLWLGGIGGLIWIAGVIDAYIIAKKLKSGTPVGELQIF